ncbi:hypothetical protein [Bradyrhizobium brasilense]|nr:hypothetical protein [Bradyrhizobium brasilense]
MTNINESLKAHNTRLVTGFVLTKDRSGMDCLPVLQVEKINARSRRPPLMVVPTFCPFCGEKYPRQGEEGDTNLPNPVKASLGEAAP